MAFDISAVGEWAGEHKPIVAGVAVVTVGVLVLRRRSSSSVQQQTPAQYLTPDVLASSPTGTEVLTITGGGGGLPGPLPIVQGGGGGAGNPPIVGETNPGGVASFLPSGTIVAAEPGAAVYPPSGYQFAIGQSLGPSPTGYNIPQPAAYGTPGWSNEIANLNDAAQAYNAAQPESTWAISAGLPPPGSPPVAA